MFIGATTARFRCLGCLVRLNGLRLKLAPARQAKNLPPWILTLILNLTEFMEIQGAPLPVDTTLLGRAAEKAHAYAKPTLQGALVSPRRCFPDAAAGWGLTIFCSRDVEVRHCSLTCRAPLACLFPATKAWRDYSRLRAWCRRP